MRVYWLSLRIAADDGFQATHARLSDALEDWASGLVWCETDSFYMFECDFDINDLAGRIGSLIRPDRDLVLLGMPYHKAGRVIGHSVNEDVFMILPFLRAA